MKIPLLPQLMPARAAALALSLLTTGFGTAGGTWAAPTTNNATQGWSTSATGVNAMSGTTNTTTADALNFGTGTASYGLGAGTITVSGTVSAKSPPKIGFTTSIFHCSIDLLQKWPPESSPRPRRSTKPSTERISGKPPAILTQKHTTLPTTSR
ncbi:MAG: hypothetical protein NTW41_04020 [Verrucomicrobia bacterium]|nr:hypothetical protein [Verrucomicrobiota bacterium]